MDHPANKKFHAVHEVIRNGRSVAEVSASLGVSRKALYSWIHAYRSAGPRVRKFLFVSPRYVRGSAHHKCYRHTLKSKLIKEICKNPLSSATTLAQTLGVGRHALVSLLTDLGLGTRLARQNFSRLYNDAGRLNVDIKKQVVGEVLYEGKSVQEVSTSWHVARKTVHEWIRRSQAEKGLSDRYVSGFAHPKALPESAHRQIMKNIVRRPESSIRELARSTGYSAHAIHSMLAARNLSSIPRRQAYVEGLIENVQIPRLERFTDRTISVWPKFSPQHAAGPPPPPASPIFKPFSFGPDPVLQPQSIPFTRQLLFKYLSKSIFSSVLSLLRMPFYRSNPRSALIISFSIPVVVSLFFRVLTNTLMMFAHVPSMGIGIGYFFSLIALVFGFFFLLYSAKYYISILLVLLFSRKSLTKSGQNVLASTSVKNGLLPDVSHIQLERNPFISIHLPLFNEKRVVNRLLEAVTSIAYENFEVIVCDDSTDETKDLVADWAKHPKVKISHRETRSGFKGAALKQAMKIMDPRTEFVMVFDADFLPFPDTIEQFLKYFKNVVGSLEQKKYSSSKIAALQGYQWHVLNKSENWITRGVRTEYGGSYVIERSSEEIYSGLKQIAGSVFMIRADVLKDLGWKTSITEDFELTLRLYSAGYKVVYTPYIQAPSECVSTLKRLVRQRMRWAEGHSFNMKKYFWELMLGKLVYDESSNVKHTFIPSPLTLSEKFELVYLAPYYLQSFFFIAGTLAWFIAEAVFRVQLPFWTAVWGWSLVMTNIISLPLMNIVGMFMEEAEEKDYFGIASFIALTYTIAPFQAYAAVKGFIESSEGPWFRTPKTGRITDNFGKGKFYSWLFSFLQKPQEEHIATKQIPLPSFVLPRVKRSRVGNLALSFLLIVSVVLSTLSPKLGNMPTVNASEPALGRVGETQDGKMGRPEDGKMGERKDSKERNPTNKAEILENISRKEISGKRIISRTSKGGKNVDYIFGSEPDITIKLDGYEVQFVTKLLAGKVVRPQKATMLHDKEVLYSEIIKDVDLRYRLTNDLLVEEFIVKTPEAAKLLGASIEQEVRGVGIQFVSPTPETFGIYSKDGKEIFTLSQPFAVDAKGVKNNDFKFELNNGFAGYTLTKKFGASVQGWFASSEREYPIIIDPSVVVTGGIAEGDTQFGGLQRKVVFVNSNWYAFYNDAGVVSYQKSADGVSWGGAVTVSDGDADNYNPSVAVSGNVIIAGWVDTSTSYDMRSIETDNSDGLGANCNLGGATMTTTQMLSIAATSTTSALIASSDTSNDTDVGMVEFSSIDLASTATTCAFNDRTTGTITFGAGLTAGDRPVIVSIGSNRHAMIFQDGDLSYSIYDDTLDEWVLNNLTIASVTDNVYSVVSDGAGKVWILSVSGTTATNFYSCCTDDWAETSIDADAGGNNQDGTSDIDMFCPTEDDCKIVYTDDIDTTAPKMKFVDCNDATCSSPTVTTVDADIGASGDQAGSSVYCPTATDCKIVYGDAMDTTLPLLSFADCNDAACSAPTITTNVDADLGGATSILHTAIHCVGGATDCKILYNDSGLSDVLFVDCPDAACTATGRTTTTLDATSGTAPKLDMDCSPGATDCKVVYHDTSATGGCADAAALCMMDCGNATCTVAGGTFTAVDGDIGATTNQPVMAIDCSAGSTDCKIVYGDVTAGDAFFVDCPDSACTATGRTITTLDTAGGAAAQIFSQIDIDCVSATDCKLSYVGNTTTGSEEGYFIDCDGAACATGSVVEMKGPRFAGAIVCLTSTNCKFAYYDGTSAANPAVVFADCDVTNCFPSASSLTAPWTSETNVTSVSLTYDSSNSDLYAHIIKDASEQAYWNSSDATTISWNGSTSYGFTAGDLGHISAPITGTGPTDIGVVVRQGTNFEFSVVPENIWLLVIVGPLYYLWRRRKRVTKKDFII